jgi:aryl-alcohol dehydrogenase-like predicted oxidoreductase
VKLSVSAVSGSLAAAALVEPVEARTRNQRPTMTYRKLGRTPIVSSRLVFGCGAALAGGKAVRLLDRAFEAGINCFDVGSNIYYKGSEQSLAPFMKEHRGEIWVISKAPAPVRAKQGQGISVEQAQGAAKSWSRLLDGSLKDLRTERIDAYYLMAVNNPDLALSEEIQRAFERARSAGKVDYFGISVHSNTEAVLKAAVRAGCYDLLMIAITPAGWYDWDAKDLVEGTPTLRELRPVLEQAHKAGIGLVGMKTVRHIAPKAALGRGDPTAFDAVYDAETLSQPLNPYQRAYRYVLDHGLDVVNADMQNFKHLEENLAVVAPG